MGGGHDIRSRHVNAGVDGEGSLVDRVVAVEDLAGVRDEQQVGDADVGEGLAEGVDPEGIGVFWIAGCDVASHALAEAELAEDPEGCS